MAYVDKFAECNSHHNTNFSCDFCLICLFVNARYDYQQNHNPQSLVAREFFDILMKRRQHKRLEKNMLHDLSYLYGE